MKFRGAGRGAAGRLIQDYSIVPGRRNWQIETAAWIWPSFFHCALETRWLGVRKTCGIGLFYRNYRPLLQETGWLVSDFISVCLETRWLGQKKWFLCPGTLLYIYVHSKRTHSRVENIFYHKRTHSIGTPRSSGPQAQVKLPRVSVHVAAGGPFEQSCVREHVL